jgi:hypothetical protein
MSIPAAAALRADPRVGEPVTVGTGETVRLVPAAEGHGAGLSPSPGGSRTGSVSPEQSLSGSGHGRGVRSWPLLVLALPAAVAVWSGWVAIGRLTGFGEVHPLPGIWDSLHLDTAVTLPVGVEAYAAYALRAWLSASAAVSDRTRRFACWSAVGSLLLGMAGQVAYHLLAQARATHAPWGITTAVSCLPVLVLGMGAALAHLQRADAHDAGQPGQAGPPGPGQAPDRADRVDAGGDQAASLIRPDRLVEAQALAARLTAAGQRVSRRSLRRAGLHGSNAELGAVALIVGSQHLPAG